MDRDDASKPVDVTPVTTTPPLIVDLGNKSPKAIKKLKRGSGKLLREVDDAVAQVVARLPEGDRQKQIIPVVVIYGKKRKKASLPSLPFSPFSLLR